MFSGLLVVEPGRGCRRRNSIIYSEFALTLGRKRCDMDGEGDRDGYDSKGPM